MWRHNTKQQSSHVSHTSWPCLRGVVSTTPLVVSTWPTPLTTLSSEEGVSVVLQVGAVPAPTQRLSHALGGPAAPSRHIAGVSSVTAPVAWPSGQGMSGTTTLSAQGDTGKDVMEIDEKHIENLADGLRDNVLLRDRDDGSMEMDNACFGQSMESVNLDDSEHKVGRPRLKQLNKNKSLGKKNEGHKGGQASAEREPRNQPEDLGSDHCCS